MAYTPTFWENEPSTATPLSAANLNKLTDEIDAQATALSISHSLPTWTNDAAPALTDPAPLNEMERVVEAISVALELTYTPTIWESGWTPARNAARLNHLELQVELTSAPPDPEPPPGSFQEMEYPAAFHVFGGNSQTAFNQCDFVVASTFAEGNPSIAKNAGNPTLVAMAHLAWQPYNSVSTQRKGHAFTYGAGLSQWPGGTDNLQPLPGSTIRAFNASIDNGCVQTDGLQGFSIDDTSTSDFFLKLFWYEWKLRRVNDAWDGAWSDNLFPGNLLASGNVYGSCASTISSAAWDAGLVKICKGFRDRGVSAVGGNQVYRSTNATVRSATNASILETGESAFVSASAFATNLGHVEGWFNGGPAPRYMGVMHIIAQSNAAAMRKGLALASIMKGAYMPYLPESQGGAGHASLYQPTEMFPRRRWGKRIGSHSRVGNTFSQQFEAGVVSHNFDNGVSVFPS